MTALSRRQALAAGGASLIAGLAAPAVASAAEAADPGLHAIATAKGMRFGSAYAWGMPDADRGSFANPLYAGLLERDCGLLVPENELKWQFIRPGPDQFAFEHFDAMLAWAESRHMAVRGHNLLWHRDKWMPRWVNAHDFGARPASEAERLLTTHIQTVLRRYGTRIASYDVVNETVNEHDGTLEQTVFSRAMGSTEAVLATAFHTARAEAPHAQLVYNDYMSWEPGMEQHCAGVLRLLQWMRREKLPVDALGVQSHIITQGRDARTSLLALQDKWRRFLDEVTAMGFDLLITEFDVRDNNLPADPIVRDRAVADYTRAYFDVMLDYPRLRDVLAWGMCDRYSWIEGFEPRKDGAKRRPCPYDDRFAAKPMRAAIADALGHARPRKA